MHDLLEVLLGTIEFATSSIRFSKGQKQVKQNFQDENNTELHLVETIQRLLQERKKIQAIKLYRKATGVGLRDAKRAVERIARQREQETADSDAENGGQEKMEQVWRHIRAKQQIHAIKAYHEATGAGLTEAKRAVERMSVEISQVEPDLIDPDKLQGLIRSRQKLQAIKYYRQQRGVGLREAKDAVDWLEAQMRIEQSRSMSND